MKQSSYRNIVATRIREARKQAEFTQTDVEEEIGIKSSTLSQYETGRIEPSVDTIGNLAVLYDVSIDWIFGIGAPKKTPSPTKALKELEREAKREAKRERAINVSQNFSIH